MRSSCGPTGGTHRGAQRGQLAAWHKPGSANRQGEVVDLARKQRQREDTNGIDFGMRFFTRIHPAPAAHACKANILGACSSFLLPASLATSSTRGMVGSNLLSVLADTASAAAGSSSSHSGNVAALPHTHKLQATSLPPIASDSDSIQPGTGAETDDGRSDTTGTATSTNPDLEKTSNPSSPRSIQSKEESHQVCDSCGKPTPSQLRLCASCWYERWDATARLGNLHAKRKRQDEHKACRDSPVPQQRV